MRLKQMGSWMLAAGVLALGLAGCGNFWEAPSSSSSSSSTTTTLSGGYFYVLDTATAQIISYDISSGSLNLVSTISAPSTPIAIAVAPDGDYLCVSTAAGVYVYTISSGVLTLGNSSNVLISDPATAIAIDSTSSWVLEASSEGVLTAIPVASTTGTLSTSYSSESVQLTGSAVNQLAFAANNSFVFAAEGSSGTEEFSFKASSSKPLGTSATATIALKGSSALSVAVDPSDRMVYIGETAASSSSGGLRAFTYTASSGAVTELSASPYSSGGTGPYGILATSSAVYVANWTGQSSSGKIVSFVVGSSSGAYSLTKLSTTASTGARPMSIITESTGNFAIVGSEGGTPYLQAFIFDTSTTGLLDSVITSSTYEATALAAAQ